MSSEEFNRVGRFVAGLYAGLLARDAEPGGWLYQRNAIATGQATTTLLTSNFLNSAEWGLRFGTPNDTEFVRLLYRNVLLKLMRRSRR